MEVDMNGFVVPNMQAWFRQNSFICTPDNGLLYHSRSDVNYIAPLGKNHMPRVKIIGLKSTIKSLACSPDWSERREFATFDEQNSLQVWDIDQGAATKGHKGHTYKLHKGESRGGQSNEVTSAICFTQTQKIISCDHSVVIIYCLATDTFKIYADFFKSSQTVVVLSPCPADRDVFAAGFKNGLIQLFSIRDMTMLRSMRGHDTEIVSIDWMQVRVKAEPEKISWRREERPKKEARKRPDKGAAAKIADTPTRANTSAAADTSDIFDIYDYDDNKEEFGTMINREASKYEARDRFREKVQTTEGFNFLEACQSLKKDIEEAKEREKEDQDDDVAEDAEKKCEMNTDDENELDEAEKFRDFIIVDEEGKEGAVAAEKDEEEDGDPKLILVTGSRENVIFFWDHDSGIPVDKIMLASNQKSNKRLFPGIFITVAWVNPTKIVANNVSGHVYEWNLSFFYRGGRVRMTANQGIRYPVDMAIYVVRSRGTIAGSDPDTDYVWCQSINRKIIGLSVTERPEIVADLACLATGNTLVAENPLESTILAVGCVDRNLVTINLASMAYNDINCVRFMNKVCSKVTSLDWHPERENFIAFGTAEGRIGLLDTNSPNNVPVLLNSFLSTDVYVLKWCEMTDEFFNKTTVLFATGKSKLAYYKMAGPVKHDPIELHQYGMVSCVSASEHYLFIGTQDGFLFVSDLSKNLTQLYHRNISRRYICSMQFKDGVLAIASNECSIRLIDFSNGMDDKVDDNIRQLEGHTEGVCCLRWGHGDSKLLVSGSFDNTVRVWNTASCSCIALYRNTDSVFCAIFSPIQENIVIYTGKGTTLACFDYTKHPVTEAALTKKARIPVQWATEEGRNDKKASRDKRRAGKPLNTSNDRVSADTIAPDVVPTAAAKMNGTVSHDTTSANVEAQPSAKQTSDVDELTEHLKAIKFKEIRPAELKSNVPTTFHLANKEINKASTVLACLVKLIDYEEPDEDDVEENGTEEVEPKKTDAKDENRYFNEKLFMGEKDLKELIDEETKHHHIAKTASIGAILLPQIGFKLKEEIISRIASKRLTDQLVALAPSISYEFWRKCCEAYGYQLLEKQYPLASIPYFLASHKITEAIDYLCKHKYFREAFAICKLRKAHDDPIQEQVADEWAQHLEISGNFEGAALVWTASKKYQNAVNTLCKRKEITDDIRSAIDALNMKLRQETEQQK